MVEFAKQLYIGVTDVRPEVISCPRVDVQKIHNNRYTACLTGLRKVMILKKYTNYNLLQGLLTVCGIIEKTLLPSVRSDIQKYAIKAMTVLCRAVNEQSIEVLNP
jgi:hypothetical protein